MLSSSPLLEGQPSRSRAWLAAYADLPPPPSWLTAGCTAWQPENLWTAAMFVFMCFIICFPNKPTHKIQCYFIFIAYTFLPHWLLKMIQALSIYNLSLYILISIVSGVKSVWKFKWKHLTLIPHVHQAAYEGFFSTSPFSFFFDRHMKQF